jgi:cobalt-zinc-cadmium efflux system membrane fusion protein
VLRVIRGILTLGVFTLLAGLFAFAANDGRAPWASEPDHGEDWCSTHETVLSTCEQCNVTLARGGTFSIQEREPEEGECPNTVVRITLAPGAAADVDLEFHEVKPETISERIRANAETRYPPSKYARVAPRIPGVISEVKAILGEEVEAGTVLAIVESTKFGEAKAEFLQAVAVLDLREQTYEREKGLFEKKISSKRELLTAKTELAEASLSLQRTTQMLNTLGLTAEQVTGLESGKDTSNRLEVVAPFKGTVVQTSAVIGERATPEKPIFCVAAMDRLWLSVDVYERDLPKVEPGQRAYFRVEGLPGRRFSGRVVAIGGEVDDRTRTVPVFVDLKNSQRLLRSQMFGQAEIVVKRPEPTLLVPRAAVQSDGDCNLVFVSPKKDVFQARAIELGAGYEGGYEVVGGLAEGERVVTTGSFLLKTEVLRGQMGAG